MGVWTTFSGLYTHSVRYGIIKGQIWAPREPNHYPNNEIIGITVSGYVIFDRSENKLILPGKMYVRNFLEQYKLTQPVILKAHIQHGDTRVQIFREKEGVMVARGHIKDNYEWNRCNCKCHHIEGVIHVIDCCEGVYKLYPWAKQKNKENT